MARARNWAWALALGVGLAATPARLPAQEIYQAVILDLTDLTVHVTVARARGDDRILLLLRDTTGRVRQASDTPVSSGQASGGTTILTIALPLLEAPETEFRVAPVTGGTGVLGRAWGPNYVPRGGVRRGADGGVTEQPQVGGLGVGDQGVAVCDRDVLDGLGIALLRLVPGGDQVLAEAG